MKKLYMLVGIPGTGKSTWIKNQDWVGDCAIISSDNHIAAYADSVGGTYNSVFDEYYSTAATKVIEDVKSAIINDKDVIWDQTNISVKSRNKKIALFDDYYKIAVYFKIPDDDELERRLKSRPGKTISRRVLYQMTSALETPTIEEGFDEIWYGG